LLQWGRDQLIAEFRGFRAACASERRASMGPRSADRGIADPKKPFDHDDIRFNGAAIS